MFAVVAYNTTALSCYAVYTVAYNLLLPLCRCMPASMITNADVQQFTWIVNTFAGSLLDRVNTL